MILEEVRDGDFSGLYITYKMTEGLWCERIRLQLEWARFPVVSPDGRYPFFMGEEGIYWVNTSFINYLKPDELKQQHYINVNNRIIIYT